MAVAGDHLAYDTSNRVSSQLAFPFRREVVQNIFTKWRPLIQHKFSTGSPRYFLLNFESSCFFGSNPPVVCSTDRSTAVVPVLVLLFVALWFILRGDLLYVFPSLTTAVKMVGRSVDKKDEIRAYIKARSKLGCSLKKLMTEISTALDLLVCLMTQFGDGKRNLSLV